MNDLTVFTFDTNTIRVVDQDGNPWFVLRDLLDSMGSSTPTAVAVESIKQGLGEGFNNVIPLQTAGGEQQTIIVAESAATFLVARSNTEQGRKLNRFIHIEVLPSIRKTGGYQSASVQPFTTEQRAAELTPAFVLAAKAFGFEGNQAILSADKAVRAITGVSPLTLMGHTHLLATTQEVLLTPTDLGKRLGVSPSVMNTILDNAGLQVSYRDLKNKLCHELTEEGKAFGEYLDTGKKHANGTPIRQIKWNANVLETIGANM